MRRGRTIGFLVVAAAILAFAAGAFFGARQFLVSYLFAWSFCLGLALGSLSLLMLHDLTGGKWGDAIRGPLNAAASTLPLVAVLFIPILFGVHILYPWTHSHSPEVLHKAVYLNIPFFVVRAILYFACWIGLAFAYVRHRERAAPWAGGGLVLYVVTMTFAGWDWMMSLEPAWWSTIYGMIVIVGQGLSALALMAIAAAALSRSEKQLQDIGNLVLTFVIFWTYCSFSQFLLIWVGDIKAEIAWYLPRMQTSWVALAIMLISFYFFVPFLALLFRSIKKTNALLAAVGAAILLMRLVELFWTVAPAIHPAALYVSWMDVVAPIALGGLWLIAFLTLIRRGSLAEVLHA